jgi:hypothetical protein
VVLLLLLAQEKKACVQLEFLGELSSVALLPEEPSLLA